MPSRFSRSRSAANTIPRLGPELVPPAATPFSMQPRMEASSSTRATWPAPRRRRRPLIRSDANLLRLSRVQWGRLSFRWPRSEWEHDRRTPVSMFVVETVAKLSAYRILVVEDDPIIALGVADMLEQQ